jgi:hypothetical protein
MMRRHWIIPIAAALSVAVMHWLPARGEGEATTDVIVTNADATKQVTVVASTPLQTLLGPLAVRVAFNYGDAAKTLPLVAVPTELNTLLGQVAARIVHHYADASYTVPLSFPKVLVNDTVPPQAPGQVVGTPDNGQVVLVWTSAEFTKATVAYGTQPGNTPNSVSETDFTTQHRIVLPNVAPGTVLYIRITQTDLSGNTAAPSDYQVATTAPKKFIHLPLVRR